jgi:CO/xanthine dehydrogenase Mo-binding subunit
MTTLHVNGKRRAFEAEPPPLAMGGDARAALASSARVVEAVYSYPYKHHATMEIMNATAKYTPQTCEVYKRLLGGGFGRRGATHDWVHQAVTIAKEMPGAPVKLIWSRDGLISKVPQPPCVRPELVEGCAVLCAGFDKLSPNGDGGATEPCRQPGAKKT